MTIAEYIRKHEQLSQLDFLEVYFTIIELIKDGMIAWDIDVSQIQS